MRTLPDGIAAPTLLQMTSASTSSEEDHCTRSIGNGNGSGAGMSEELRRAKRRSLGMGAFRSERQVDRMLDRMAGEEGSDCGELDGGLYGQRGYRHVNSAGGER